MVLKFVFNNVELEADFSNLETVESYEKALVNLAKLDGRKFSRWSEAIRCECVMVNEAFDMIFGEGSADKLFQGKMNREVSYHALSDLIDYAEKSRMLADEEIRKYASKYQRK